MLFVQNNADGSQPKNLDSCNGHSTDELDYHYHANDAGKNKILGCFKAESGCAVADAGTSCALRSKHGKRPPPGNRK